MEHIERTVKKEFLRLGMVKFFDLTSRLFKIVYNGGGSDGDSFRLKQSMEELQFDRKSHRLPINSISRVGVGDWLKERISEGDLREERRDGVEGGDGLKEKEKEVTSLKEKENEGRLDERRRRR
ncbi:hypothetical protein Syun_023635 [Stephania yunnanensis]|uniref:Uncharacterized protein n=1 Tax=Stephania yunnanensis TaxID=152371 RepID=A0AAP0I3V2_9MAGN